jgi:hypothetical protein
MKALPYLNLSTHMRFWDDVMLEGDIEVNCFHGLYLKLRLTLHDLRTNFSYEPWLTLSYTFFSWMALTWFFEGCPRLVPRTL